LTNRIFFSSNQNASVASVVGGYSDNPQPPSNTVPEIFSSSAEVDVSSSTIQEDNESKHGTMASEGNEYSVVHTSPNYNLGFMSPMLETQSAQIDNSESQARDMSRLQNFVVSPLTYISHLSLFTYYYALFS
jgi:hypothetical protein